MSRLLRTIGSCFFINSFWTFNTKDASLRRFVKYTIVSLLGLALTTTITYVGVNVLKIWYLYTQGVVVAVVPLSNYVLNRQWVFSDEEAQD